MDTKSVQQEVVKTSPPKKEEPLADAKKAFAEAVAKTKEQGEIAPIAEEPKPKKVAAKGEPKPEIDKSAAELAAIRAEMAEMRKQLQKPEPKAEKKVSDFEDVESELAEQFGEDEGKILTGALRKLLEPREQRIAQMEQLIQKAVEQSKKASARSNKDRLSKEYDLSEEAWEIVQDRAQKLVADGKHESADEAYESVVKALYPGKSPKEQAEEVEELASQIAASTPTQPSVVRRERKLSAADKQRQVFNHLLKNPEDVAGAKRLSQELRIDKD